MPAFPELPEEKRRRLATKRAQKAADAARKAAAATAGKATTSASAAAPDNTRGNNAPKKVSALGKMREMSAVRADNFKQADGQQLPALNMQERAAEMEKRRAAEREFARREALKPRDVNVAIKPRPPMAEKAAAPKRKREEASILVHPSKYRRTMKQAAVRTAAPAENVQSIELAIVHSDERMAIVQSVEPANVHADESEDVAESIKPAEAAEVDEERSQELEEGKARAESLARLADDVTALWEQADREEAAAAEAEAAAQQWRRRETSEISEEE